MKVQTTIHFFLSQKIELQFKFKNVIKQINLYLIYTEVDFELKNVLQILKYNS